MNADAFGHRTASPRPHSDVPTRVASRLALTRRGGYEWGPVVAGSMGEDGMRKLSSPVTESFS